MQIQLMKQFCGCARYVYNRTLSLERSLYKKDNKHSFKYAEAANRLPEWKKKNPFLKECHSQVLQQSLKDLDQAYTNFFRKRANFPKYKEKFRNDSIRFPQGVELDEVKQQIRLPKIGWMGYRKSRDIIGTIKNVTVSRRGEKWDVSIQTVTSSNLSTLSSRSRKNLQNFKESLRDKRKEAETAERQSEKLLDCTAI